VATAIALFGPGSGAALATVVGVLIEVSPSVAFATLQGTGFPPGMFLKRSDIVGDV
jgi:hypothetical protein